MSLELEVDPGHPSVVPAIPALQRRFGEPGTADEADELSFQPALDAPGAPQAFEHGDAAGTLASHLLQATFDHGERRDSLPACTVEGAAGLALIGSGK